MRIHKKDETSKDTLQIESNADYGDSTDFACLTELNVVGCDSLIHPPPLRITEVYSLNDGFSSDVSPAPEKIPRHYAALPGPSEDPLLLKMDEDKNDPPIRIEVSPCDVIQLDFDEKEKSPSNRQRITSNQLPDGPPNSDRLKLEISNEHSQECDFPSGLEPKAARLSNVVIKSPITEELKPSDVFFDFSRYPSVEPTDLKLDDSQSYLPVDVSEMENQNCGPSTNSNPEIFCADDSVIRCGICDFKTLKKYKYKLRDHMNVHTGDRPYACNSCGSRFRYKGNLFTHKRIHSGAIPFTHTRNCGSPINSELIDPSQVELEELQDEPQNDPLQCDFTQDCGLTNSEPQIIYGDDNSFKCSVCEYATRRRSRLRDHMYIHTGDRPYGCDFCNYTAKRRDSLKSHVKAVHIERERGSYILGRKRFACDFCDRSYLAKRNLKRHMVIHNREPLRYDSPKSKSNSTSEQSHVNSTHVGDETSSNQSSVVELPSGGEGIERNINTCELSDYPFTTSTVMNQHIRKCQASGSLGLCEEFQKPFTCNISDYKTGEGVLASHISVYHGGVKQLTCTHSDYKADEELSDHITSVHSEEDEYACYSCDFKSNNVKDVERHILTTHNPFTVETPSCAETSTDMSPTEVDTSIPPQGDVNEYSCYACDYKSSEVSQVEEHILSTHSIKNAHEIAAPPDSTSESQGCDASALSVVRLQDYFCYACDYKAGNIEQVQQHILSTHKLPISQPTTTLVDLTTENSDTEQ